MKTLILTSLLGLALQPMAQADGATAAFKALGKQLDALSEFISDNDVQYIYASATADAKTVAEAINDKLAEACLESRKFKKTTAHAISRELEALVEETYQAVPDAVDALPKAKAAMQRAGNKLKSQVGGRALKLCRSESVPAYSDGHTMNFVTLDGEPVFLWEVGQPD